MNRRRSSVPVQAGRAHDSKRLAICGSIRITWSASLVPRATIETRNLFDRYFRIFRAARCSRGVHAKRWCISSIASRRPHGKQASPIRRPHQHLGHLRVFNRINAHVGDVNGADPNLAGLLRRSTRLWTCWRENPRFFSFTSVGRTAARSSEIPESARAVAAKWNFARHS
jgi:hypothetical protein